MSVIQNALSGALASQVALNTSSQNIANVMTKGYTRQGAMLSSVQPQQSGQLSAGGGVAVSSLMRFSDDYKNLQMWQAASTLGQHATPQPYLTQLEQVMGDETTSINTGLDAFFGALNAASVEPTSSPLRQQVITTADALAQRFNSLNTVLAGQRGTIYQQRITAVAQINSLTSSIASLNEKIAATQATGVNASGLIDERDQKIDDLSGFVGLQVVSQADGTRSVALRSGQPLVVGNLAATLVVQTNVSGAQSLQLNFAKESFALRGQGLGGQLGGIGDFEQNVLSPLMQSVSDMAGEIASRFNNQLAAGFAPDGTPGKPLFVFDATSSTHMLQVQPGILPQELGFSADSTQPGNSDNLLTLIGLKQQPITVSALGNVLMGDAYTQLTSVLAMRSQQNEAARGTAQTVRDQAESSWKSTSGVNTDEEAINLMQYQQMYQANMKVIAVANELFNSTLSMMN